MLRAVLRHAVSQLIVHVVHDSHGRIARLAVFLADDLGLDRALSREGIHDRLRLKLHQSLRQQRMGHAARALPRLRAVFQLHA